MDLFLTSSPTIGWAGPLNPANGFVDALRKALTQPIRCVMVSSFPDDVEITDRMAWELRECFEWADMKFHNYEVVDRRTALHAATMLGKANFVILCGGHVPTENAFFRQINLRRLLKDFQGAIMGISAGSMNCADLVYSPPELKGEALDPDYRQYFKGLGLTDVNIMPHFQSMRNERIDGYHLVRDLMAPHSFDKPIYCLTDGAYFHASPAGTILCGEAYRLSRGVVRKVCANGECKRLAPNGRLYKT